MLHALVRLTLAYLVLGLLPGVRGADGVRSPWMPVQSDLPPDPSLVDRRLANGVRYLILPNAEPKDHVSLRLVVGVGSLYENEDELGLAHFVEHMAFRGTRDFPNGKMAETLEHLGIGWGPDSTAFTSYDHTIFHLELPNTEAATLKTAVHALREYAGDVTFDPGLIEKERGVILSEMATRDTPDARAYDFNLRLLWPSSRHIQRKVIGTTDSIRHFTRDQFVAFYDAWYRPERIALIIVGPVDVGSIETLIQAEFGSLSSRAPPRPTPETLVTEQCGPPDVGVFRDPSTVGLWIALEHAIRSPQAPDTHERRVHELRRSLAFAMLGLRLQKLASDPSCSFVAPTATVTSSIDGWELATLGVNGRLSNWRAAAIDLESEHRRAVQFGFTPAELEEVRANFAMRFEQAVRSSATRPSPWLAQQLLQTLLHGTVFSTPTTLQRDLAGDLAATQLKDCLTEFRAAWRPKAPTVYVVANSRFEVSREAVAKALNANRELAVTRPADVPLAEFAYTDFGPPGHIVREEHLEDLDVRLTQFANGVRLNFKPTKFVADAVDVRVRIGNGKLSQPLSMPGLDTLANVALIEGGLERHTRQQLSDILSSHALHFSFGVYSDSCVFYGRAAPRDLRLLLQVITAFVTDASYRPDAIRHARAEFGSIMAQLLASPGGAISALAQREILNNDGRFGLASYDELLARDMGELAAWLEPQFKHGPIELSVVGDVDWGAARDAVAATLGSLAPRPAPSDDHSSPIPVTFSSAPSGLKVYPMNPRLKQVALAWFWPVTTVADFHEERRCNLLASILQERLRMKVREGLGAAYSPAVAFQRIDGFPNINYFTFYVEVAPENAGKVLEIVQRETKELSTKGPSADEFARAKTPYLRAMTDDLLQNGYWGGTVLSAAQQQPERIAAARDRAADLAAITRREITALAKRDLIPSQAFKFATAPSVTVGTR